MAEDETTKIWVTKYALSTGVFTVMAEVHAGMAAWRNERGSLEFAHKNDFHLSAYAANFDVKRRIEAKRRSLNKALKKLDTLSVEIPD